MSSQISGRLWCRELSWGLGEDIRIMMMIMIMRIMLIMMIINYVRYEDTCRSYFTVKGIRGPLTHIRLNIFPDGGVAR